MEAIVTTNQRSKLNTGDAPTTICILAVLDLIIELRTSAGTAIIGVGQTAYFRFRTTLQNPGSKSNLKLLLYAILNLSKKAGSLSRLFQCNAV